MMENIDIISTVGFPIAVTAYLLYERHKLNTKIVESLEHVATVLDAIDRRLP